MPEQGLCEQLHITEEELRSRRAFLQFSREDAKNLREIAVVIREHVDAIIDEFYDHLTAFPELHQFLPDDETVRRLKATQRDYLLTLGQKAGQLEYCEDRLKIGAAHERVGLPQKWYLGAYVKLYALLVRRLVQHYAEDARTLMSLVITLQKMFQMDQILAVETYYHATTKRLQASLIELEETRRHLEEHVRLDGLTQIYNHQYLKEALEAEVLRSRRFRHAFSILFLDLDLFKHINDQYGHAFGDVVLQRTVEQIKRVVRPADILGRYGGEEFVVGLVECDESTAIRIAERVREKVGAVPVLQDGRQATVTVSIGVATLTTDIDKIETLITRADQALYLAKSLGRNRVEVFSQKAMGDGS